MSKVLACIDASMYADSVIDHAAWCARRMPASVEILHVLDKGERQGSPDLSGSIGLGAGEHLLQQLARADEVRSRLEQERGRALLKRAEQRVRDADVLQVTTRFRHGSFLETVTELEAGADLVVIGKRGESADFAKLHLGSQLERVVRASALPVLVASRAFKPIETVVIAFDGSPSARRAVERVGVRPAFEGLRHQVLMVGPDDAEHRRQLDWAQDALAKHGEAAEFVLRQGAVDKVISEHVRDSGADLLVMGAYGHSRLREFIVGSTTTTLARTCPIPLLMYR